MQVELDAMIEEEDNGNDDKSVSSLDDNEIFTRGEDDLPMPPVNRVVSSSSDGQHNLRSSQNSSHSAWSESSSYTRTKQRRGVVNRTKNGVLAPTNPNRRRSMDSSLSASDSNIRLSDHSNQNQEQLQQQKSQQQHEPQTSNYDESRDNYIQADRKNNNGHEGNNVEETQIQATKSNNNYYNEMDRNNVGHEDNNVHVDETQIQPKIPKSFCTRCCRYGWQYVFACAPMKRYRKRSSGITTMENQYFIPPPEENTTFFESIIYTMNGYGQDFVVWLYQSSFFAVLAIFFMSYYALVFAFAGIALAGERASEGRCTYVTETLMSSGSMFEFAFELSWTTFTTVGYGQVAPSGEGCYPLRIGCSFFAFMGLLFNATSAAIFFSKLERVLTKASVTFSSSVCLQFDTTGSRGARMGNTRMGISLRSVQGESVAYQHFSRPGEAIPYPFLEFRIVNDHANHARGVRNASCAALVSLSGEHAELISGEGQQSSEVYKEFVTRSFSLDDGLGSEPQSTSTGKTGTKTPSFYSVAKSVMKANNSPRKARRSSDQSESDEPLPSQEDNAHASVESVDPARKAREPQNPTTGKTASKTVSFYSAAKTVMKANASSNKPSRRSSDPLPIHKDSAAVEKADPARKVRPSARSRSQRLGMVGLTESIKQTAVIVQENDNGKGQQVTPEGRVFFPLELEPSTNPYMNRVWYLRHTLNAKSPLLRYSVREKLKRDGVWDAELNTYQDIISCLVDFHKISFTFKGTSSASNHLLFQQKVYTMEDVYVGWRFGPLLFEKKQWKWLPSWCRRQKGASTILDKRLIHDIQPQRGGGQEPIEG